MDNKITTIYEWAESQDLSEEDFAQEIIACTAAIAISELDKLTDPFSTEMQFHLDDVRSTIKISVSRVPMMDPERSIELH